MLGTTFHQMQCQHIVPPRARRIILLHPKWAKSIVKHLICITLHHHRAGTATLWEDHLQTVRYPMNANYNAAPCDAAEGKVHESSSPSTPGAQSSGHYDRTQHHHPAAANIRLNTHSNSSVNNNDNKWRQA